MEGASGRTVHAPLRGGRGTRRSFGHAMAMVAGRRASPRAQAPRRDDERCRVSSARRLSDDRFAGETGTTASAMGHAGKGRLLTGASRAARNNRFAVVPAREHFGSSEDDGQRLRARM